MIKHLDPFTEIPNDAIEAAINRWVKGSRNREIMKDRLIDCITYERIAEKHDLSTRYVKSLIYRLEDVVFRHLGW